MIVRWIVLALLAVGLAHTSAAEEANVGAAQEDGAQQVAVLCTVCHGEDLIHQQRLTEEQWRATVEKMVHWGAQAQDPATREKIVSYLSSHYGPDAGSHVPPRIETQAARAAVAPLPDGPFAGGDAARGKQLYDHDCIACHGPTGRGQIGVNLVDRYVLYRASDFATMARKGRGLMPGRPLDDAQIGDLLAYLRELPR